VIDLGKTALIGRGLGAQGIFSSEEWSVLKEVLP
jgi:hypothetical protein